jgi:hypothetical protein
MIVGEGKSKYIEQNLPQRHLAHGITTTECVLVRLSAGLELGTVVPLFK